MGQNTNGGFFRDDYLYRKKKVLPLVSPHQGFGHSFSIIAHRTKAFKDPRLSRIHGSPRPNKMILIG